jgi:hypothetical protein
MINLYQCLSMINGIHFFEMLRSSLRNPSFLPILPLYCSLFVIFMLLERSQTAFHKALSESRDVSCLKGIRQKLSWLQQGNKVSEAFSELRDRITLLLSDFEKLVSIDIRTYLEEGIPLEEIVDAYIDQPEGAIRPDWILGHASLQNLSSDTTVPSEIAEIVSIFHQYITRRIQFLEKEEEEETIKPHITKKNRPGTNTKRIRRSFMLLIDEVRSGVVSDAAKLSRTIQEALFKEKPDLIEEALKLVILWKKAEARRQPILDADTQKPIKLPQLDQEVPLLATKLMRKTPSSEQMSLAMSALARFGTHGRLCESIAGALYEEHSQASHRDLATALWALGRLEVGEKTAGLIAKEITNRAFSTPQGGISLSRIDTVSSLYAMGVLDLEPSLAITLLDYAKHSDEEKLFTLQKNDVARCLHVAAYFSHDVEYWKARHEKNPVQKNFFTQYPNNNRPEKKLHKVLTWYVQELGLELTPLRNVFRHGLECDEGLLLPDGRMIIVEHDGPHHAFQKAYDRFRDRVLTNLGDQIIRISVDEGRELTGKKNRSLKRFNASKLGAIPEIYASDRGLSLL